MLQQPTFWVLILFYGISVSLSIFTLGHLKLFVDKLTFHAIASLLLNLPFWIGLGFALLARVLFIMINTQLSQNNAANNANTSLTFIVTLSSLVAVVMMNHFLLGEKLNSNQIIGSAIIVFGILLVLRT